MKLTKLLCLLLALMTILLVGCKDEVDDPDDTPTSGYVDPEHKKGTYKVEFVLRGKTVTQFYELNEIPEPPTVEDEKNGAILIKFKSWDKEVVPVSGNTTYTAQYEQGSYDVTATFIYAGGRTQKVKTQAGRTPVAPKIGDYAGKQFVCWDVEPTGILEDTTYHAIYTDVTTPEAMKTAWSEEVLATRLQHAWQGLHTVSGVYLMILQEYTNPAEDGIMAERAAEHLAAWVSEGGCVEFTCSTNWQYGVTTAAYAIAKKTPSVWSKLSYSDKQRIDTMMEAFAYICSFGTSDDNDYKTGPSLNGNYRKSWNPNYRLGNIPVITFVTYYFGNGNMEAGADKVNEKIRTFDAARYDSMVNKFGTYKWNLAYACWTTDGFTKTVEVDDGNGGKKTIELVSTTKAKDILVNGGNATHLSVNGQELQGSSGAGVNNRGNDYTYTGSQNTKYTLDEAQMILRDCILYNFMGGKVTNDYYLSSGEKVAWIADNTASPYFGQEGMMLEFMNGRSSTSYCTDDFVMVVTFMSCARALKKCDANGNPLTDNFGNEIPLWDVTTELEWWPKIQVGIEDYIYKMEHGYYCYATGSYGVSQGSNHGAHNTGRGYFNCKDIWRYEFLPLGSITPAD